METLCQPFWMAWDISCFWSVEKNICLLCRMRIVKVTDCLLDLLVPPTLLSSSEMLLLTMPCLFFLFSYSTFPPKFALAYLAWKQTWSTWKFNTVCRFSRLVVDYFFSNLTYLLCCAWEVTSSYSNTLSVLRTYLLTYLLYWGFRSSNISRSSCRYAIPKQKLRFPGHQINWVIEWVSEYAIFLHGLA